MAIYSLSTKPISRASGRSAVAAAAYRAGAQLIDERTGVVHDYTRRRGVEHVEVIAGPGIEIDRADLWNQAEAAERRRDARVAREHLLALPHELDADQRLALARQYAQELVERYGVAVDLAIHGPGREGDQRNHHAHLLVTTRRLSPDGLGDKVHIEWSDTKRRQAGLGSGADEITRLRQRWEVMANSALEAAQVEARIDRRSLGAQGVDRAPQIHVGPMGTEQIRRGTPERSDRARLNLEIQVANAGLHQVQQRAAMRGSERQLRELEATALEARFDLDGERRQLAAARRQLDQLDGELRGAISARDGIRGWFKGGQRREAQERVEALTDRRSQVQAQVGQLGERCRMLNERHEIASRALREAKHGDPALSPAPGHDRGSERQNGPPEAGYPDSHRGPGL